MQLQPHARPLPSLANIYGANNSIDYISKMTCPKFFLYMLPAAVARSSDDKFIGWHHVCPEWAIWCVTNRVCAHSESSVGRTDSIPPLVVLWRMLKWLTRGQQQGEDVTIASLDVTSSNADILLFVCSGGIQLPFVVGHSLAPVRCHVETCFWLSGRHCSVTAVILHFFIFYLFIYGRPM